MSTIEADNFPPDKHKIVAAVLFVLLLAGLGLPRLSWGYSGIVVEVLAGDLLRVDANGSVQKIRLYGIACPVFGQPFYDKARFLTNHLALQRNVEVTPVFRDEDGIDNVLVRISGSSDYLNNQLVGYGMAWVRPCNDKSKLCVDWKKQEGFAQMNFVGLWAQPPSIPPWEWKQAERMQIYERSIKSGQQQK